MPLRSINPDQAGRRIAGQRHQILMLDTLADTRHVMQMRAGDQHQRAVFRRRGAERDLHIDRTHPRHAVLDMPGFEIRMPVESRGDRTGGVIDPALMDIDRTTEGSGAPVRARLRHGSAHRPADCACAPHRSRHPMPIRHADAPYPRKAPRGSWNRENYRSRRTRPRGISPVFPAATPRCARRRHRPQGPCAAPRPHSATSREG